ncbi:MAG: OmpA family protein [Xanthobacteraceae bacterium]|nr:OmpA family protein [Xanthobacteraceae bacterium]QYK45222.1 MAG: OmpA family protein [Xanthobacteraceae bacterium]
MNLVLNRRRVLQAVSVFAFSSPVVALARLQPETFNIFMDFQSAEMTASARELADTIARKILPSARVTIAGNCDTAEARPDMLGLTRANAVLTYFLRQPPLVKVRFNALSNGISQPLVKTGPNIREARNRRVEITIE